MRVCASVLAALLLWQVPAHASPRDEAAWLHERAVAAITRGDDRQALRDLEEAYLLWPAPATLMDLAEVHVRLGETAQAISALRILIESKEDDPAVADVVAHAKLRLAGLQRPIDQTEPTELDVVTPALPNITPIDETPVRSPVVDPLEDEMRAPVVAPIDDYRPPSGASLDKPIQALSVKKKSAIDHATLAFAIVGSVAGLTLVLGPLIYLGATSRLPPTGTSAALSPVR